MDIGAGITFGGGVSVTKQPPPPTGQQAYTTAGTFSWTAPTGVTSVCVVAVGGGAGSHEYGAGGGGGLGWKNNISVTPGQSYTVVVGVGGPASNPGGDSYFINNTTVKGGAGTNPRWEPSFDRWSYNGGSYVGDGGGIGGKGIGFNNANGRRGGGGGAGGYSGAGGNGGSNYNTTSPTAGAGGGGGGGGDPYQGGGGVGILGAGTSGSAGGNNGGSGGANGVAFGSASTVNGGLYGGGAALYDSTSSTGKSPGANGAVRIIWGDNRAFPSTNTADMS